jgi:hypothetical protein
VAQTMEGKSLVFQSGAFLERLVLTVVEGAALSASLCQQCSHLSGGEGPGLFLATTAAVALPAGDFAVMRSSLTDCESAFCSVTCMLSTERGASALFFSL